MTARVHIATTAERTHTTLAAHWAQHLMAPDATAPGQPSLSPAEAARVQRHRDQLMAALQAHDRRALLCAKEEVLQDAFSQDSTPKGQSSGVRSPALRSALRDLSWRMAGLLLPRSPRH